MYLCLPEICDVAGASLTFSEASVPSSWPVYLHYWWADLTMLAVGKVPFLLDIYEVNVEHFN